MLGIPTIVRVSMDARAYFDLTDAISAAQSPGALEAVRTRVRATEMHPFERQVLERVLRSRAEAFDDMLPRPAQDCTTDSVTPLKAAFTARFERVRGTMSDAEFVTLLDDVTRAAARLEEIDARELGTTRDIPTFREPDTRRG